MTEAETVPTTRPEPPEAEFVKEEHIQTITSQDDDFEGLKIQDERRDLAIDCESTHHGGHRSLID